MVYRGFKTTSGITLSDEGIIKKHKSFAEALASFREGIRIGVSQYKTGQSLLSLKITDLLNCFQKLNCH